MMHRLILLFGFSALSLSVPLFADTTIVQPVQVSNTEHVNFAPGGTIRLKDSFGYVSVEGWDKNEVEITVVKSMGYDTEPAAQATQHLDGVKVVTGHPSGTELEITTSKGACPHRVFHPLDKCRDVTVEYHIRAPRNSNLVIHQTGGYVSVMGMIGNIDATNGRGDIVLMLPDLAKYSIEARTKLGLVTSDVAGATHNKHMMGEIFSHGDSSLARKLVLKMGFGGITIKELPAEAVTPAT